MSAKDLPIVKEIKDAVEILKLNKLKMAEVAARPAATKWGFVIILAPVVVNLILMAIRMPSGFGSIFSAYILWPFVIPVASFVAMIFIINFVAEKVFNAKGDYWSLFKVLAYASIVLWVSVIPWIIGSFDSYQLFNLILFAGGIWTLVVAYHWLMEHNKLNQQNAVVTLVISIVACVIVQSILGTILVGTGYRIF